MMRIPILAILLMTCPTLLAFGQDAKSATQEPQALQTFMVTLVEFRMKSSDVLTLTAVKIAEEFDKHKADGVISMVETVRLSALEKHETNVLFGRTVSVVTGVTQSQMGKTRNMTQRQTGTGVKIKVESREGKVLLNLHYQASRLAGEVKEDVAPDIETVQIDSELLLQLGSRNVVAGTSASDSTFLMVTVTR